MTYFETIILGLVQGLTEFIPVSSSGHLVLARELFNIEPSLFFDVVLHLGTLLAVLIYFREDIFNILKKLTTDRKLLWMIIVGTIPAVIAGVLLSGLVESLGESSVYVSFFLLALAIIFIAGERAYEKKEEKRSFEKIKMKDAVVIGLMQALALLPGVSRSGITMVAGFFRGIDRRAAARFSFLLSIPAISGAGIFTAFGAIQENTFYIDGPLVAGFIVSFISGFAAIAFLLKFLEKNGLKWFAGYLFVMSGFLLLIQYL